MTLLLQDGLGTWSCTAKCTATAIAASSCNGKTAWLPVQEGGTTSAGNCAFGNFPCCCLPCGSTVCPGFFCLVSSCACAIPYRALGAGVSLCGTEGTHPAECVTLQGWAGCSQLLHVDLFGLWCLLAFTAAEVMTGLHPVRSCAWLLGLFRSACGCPALSWVLFAALISTALEWLCRVQGL